jgi:hypothetical protein
MTVASHWWVNEMEIYCLMGTVSVFQDEKSSVEAKDSDDCTAM